MKSKTYVKILTALLLGIFGGTFLYIYIYAKNYPIPLFHRISLDAKMMFIRDKANKTHIDTIIVGSSIGLNNVQGIILEESSKKVEHVLNLSAFSMEVTHIEQIWELISLFPNVKRIIYSSQSLDFTEESTFEITDIDFVKGYLDLAPKSINLLYSFYAYKNFIQCIERRWEWQKRYMAHNKFSNIDFDRTGSAPLHIYGKDIIEARCINPYVAKTKDGSYASLQRIIKKAEKKNIKFYFVTQPYREALMKEHKHIQENISYYQMRSQNVVLSNNAYFLNLHTKLQLGNEYFADRMHLNDKGSIITSEAIAKFIDEKESHYKHN